MNLLTMSGVLTSARAKALWKKSSIGEPVAAAGTAYKVVMRCGLPDMLPLVGAGVAVGG